MLTEHLQPLQALVVVATEGEQALIAGQSNRWRSIINCYVGLKRIERIKAFFSSQLARQ
jgi:ABC-type hemin transport system substrate-binding protein